MNYRMLSLGTIALAVFVVGSPAWAAKDTEQATHDGRLVSVTSDKLVMTLKGSKDGKEHTHSLAADAKMTLDGKACKLGDLMAGTKIRVTTMKNDQKVATNIEAIAKNEMFADTHDGKVVSCTKSKLVMTNKGIKDGKEHSHMLATDAKLTLDGKACKAEDLKSGMKIRVTTKKTDKGTAIEVEALDKDAEFA